MRTLICIKLGIGKQKIRFNLKCGFGFLAIQIMFDFLGLISTVMLTKSFPLQRKSRTQIDFSRRMLDDALGFMLIWNFYFSIGMVFLASFR